MEEGNELVHTRFSTTKFSDKIFDQETSTRRVPVFPWDEVTKPLKKVGCVEPTPRKP